MLASEHLRRKLPTRPCYGEEQAAADTFIVMNVTSSDVGANVSEASECVCYDKDTDKWGPLVCERGRELSGIDGE